MTSLSEFPLGLEIRAALPPPIGRPVSEFFKDLFEREELNDAGTDCRMKTQTSFVRTERAVHLYAEPAINLNLAFGRRSHGTGTESSAPVQPDVPGFFRLCISCAFDGWPDRFEDLRHRLKELRLVGVTLSNNFKNLLHRPIGCYFCRLIASGQIKRMVRDAGFEPATCRRGDRSILI